MTANSFYPGQGRAGFHGYEAPDVDDLVEELRAANVENIEMGASALLTLANRYGLRAGAVCAAYANRATGEFGTEGDTRAAETVSLAVSILSSMDEAAAEAGVDHWHPGLGLPRDAGSAFERL